MELILQKFDELDQKEADLKSNRAARERRQDARCEWNDSNTSPVDRNQQKQRNAQRKLRNARRTHQKQRNAQKPTKIPERNSRRRPPASRGQSEQHHNEPQLAMQPRREEQPQDRRGYLQEFDPATENENQEVQHTESRHKEATHTIGEAITRELDKCFRQNKNASAKLSTQVGAPVRPRDQTSNGESE